MTTTSLQLATGDVAAVFRPAQGMLCASLEHRGVEMLRRIDDLDAAAQAGGTAGVPLLHPWANRLAGLRYRAADRDVVLDPASKLLHFDTNGLPIHGVPWSRLPWEIIDCTSDRVRATLDWSRPEWLGLFPYPHRLEMLVTLLADGVRIATTLIAGPAGAVPASFGFHPYVGMAGISRKAWRLRLPPLRALKLDARGIPTGEETPVGASEEQLEAQSHDAGFALVTPQATLAIAAGGTAIVLELEEGFTHVQIYAPADKEFIAMEPMTAPTAALSSGHGLRVIPARDSLRTCFALRVASPC